MNLPSIFDLSGEIILVTGGGTGLGQHFSLTLAAAGATIIVCGRRLDKIQKTVERISQTGGKAHALELDVCDSASIKRCLKQSIDIGAVTGLVNNAGVGTDLLLKDMPEVMWNTSMDTNLKGSWMLSREFVNHWIDNSRGGFIINIASILGSSVQMGTGAYAAAKAGLLHLTRAMAYEWARYDIRVNAISPGYFRTELASDFLDSEYGQKLTKRIPFKRLGDPGNLDGAILLLASQASNYMTGSIINVDGGLSMASV